MKKKTDAQIQDAKLSFMPQGDKIQKAKAENFQNNPSQYHKQQDGLDRANILIVDDKPANVKLLSTLLSNHGYKVRGAINGEMAIRAVKEIPPQLILLDIRMPGIDGYEVCRRLKNISQVNHVPIIFLSASSQIEDKLKAFELGGQDYITKPFQLPEVLMRVENQLKLQIAQTKITQLNYQLEQINSQLEQKVKLRTAELENEIRKHKETQQNLRKIAFHDALTGLPNRALFFELLQRAMERSKRRADYCFSVLFLDCDRFKVVNDSLGHLVGDQVLEEVARRIKSCLRSIDNIARLGGDEFIILLEELNDVNETELIAKRLIEELRKPLYIREHKVFLGASIGIVLETKHYQSPELILRDADTAMYRAKASGKDCYRIFKPEMHFHAQKVLQLETDLRIALEQDEFILYYQPILCLATKSVKGFEALLRWNHPQKGLISPLDFIPIAEETGLIIPIGNWVLREACHQLKIWQQQYPEQKNLTININLSVQQFAQPQLIQQIDEVLAQTQIDSKLLHLEITETAIMENSEVANDILQQLRERQITLSIDDFGTGYSSLSYLNRFPVDQLKIDRSFIQALDEQTGNVKIIDTIINLAHHLNIDVVAEGIETEQQWEKLDSLGCEFGQGYLFSKPLHPNLIDQFLTPILKQQIA